MTNISIRFRENLIRIGTNVQQNSFELDRFDVELVEWVGGAMAKNYSESLNGQGAFISNGIQTIEINETQVVFLTRTKSLILEK